MEYLNKYEKKTCINLLFNVNPGIYFKANGHLTYRSINQLSFRTIIL